ncbi:Bacterial alpha-L-rhamnosidase [candidate division KSB1 bacterium]|nr:Bacterial alpha-L-rhamnosidase [candidate division KSB1 bacterium]
MWPALLLLFFLNPIRSEPIYPVENINPDLLNQRWSAEWISHPNHSLFDYGVFHFRRAFDLNDLPETFFVHVSADNRYKLFVNGQRVSIGPARGDLEQWRFETIDLAPFLRSGKNVLAAVVWNMGQEIPFAQVTYQTGFLMQGNSETEKIVNTSPETWRILHNKAYSPLPVDKSALRTFIVIGPGDNIDASVYPWGWNEIEFDDSDWLEPQSLGRAVPYGIRQWSQPWALVPRMIPAMQDSLVRITKIAQSTGDPNPDFLKGTGDWTIPPNTRVTVLLDQECLSTAYPCLSLSNGGGATITLTYSEALFDNKRQKGHRDHIKGKSIIGYQDRIRPDGGDHRHFETLWFRTFRFIEMEIQTAGQPLVLHDFHSRFTAYPFKDVATFEADLKNVEKIWEVGWRTARLCANETYYDCPYYEQLQYAGDTRIQTFISLYVSGDDRLMRKAIQQFKESRNAEGLTQSRYPHSLPQIIPPYSLFWAAMVHDYWMLRDDPEFVASFLADIKAVLDWFEQHINPATGMLGPLPWWNFVDWVSPYPSGEPIATKVGNSSVVTLQYAYLLDMMQELFDAFDRHITAQHFREISNLLKESTLTLCWDKERGLLADDPTKELFTQHANVMGILTDLFPQDQQYDIMTKILTDTTLTECTFYYKFYLFRAMQKQGFADQLTEQLEPWHEMLDIGLSTFAEKPEPTRSDCHAWSASPLYEFLATIAGILPAEPGFKKIKIAPALGPLTRCRATMPHPQGQITVDLERVGETGLKAEIRLPEGLTGELQWNNRTVSLYGGSQTVVVDKSTEIY